MKSTVKIFSEIFPPVTFFYLHKIYNMQVATPGLVITTIIVVIAIYITERKLTKMQIGSAILVCVFGLLTVLTGDSKFIKLKPTIIYLGFAFTLLGFAYYKNYIIKHLFASMFNLPDKILKKLSILSGLFFMALAVLNEIIWRNFPEEFWVKFKVFGTIPSIMIFIISQLFFLRKYSLK